MRNSESQVRGLLSLYFMRSKKEAECLKVSDDFNHFILIG